MSSSTEKVTFAQEFEHRLSALETKVFPKGWVGHVRRSQEFNPRHQLGRLQLGCRIGVPAAGMRRTPGAEAEYQSDGQYGQDQRSKE